ncbi:MAG: carboxypeptidase-like regulatory domain-containing protein [Deltaproteobacteria bacterium]|nr:carboxypeptidase-like regulatory domain-containing protein [Deltaproteobacteria bacterium]MCL5277147.1 carboxypeptidase-like regulatory domain-containing protein [Deltaproteobacteria bacterium]
MKLNRCLQYVVVVVLVWAVPVSLYGNDQLILDAPSANGGTGLLRLNLPYSLEPGSFSIIGGVNYYDSGDMSLSSSNGVQNISNFGFVTGGITQGLEGFAGMIGSSSSQYYTQYHVHSLIQAIGDFRAGLKYSYNISPILSIGVLGSLQMMTPLQDIFYYGSAIGGYGLLLLGYDARSGSKLPMMVNMNIGYHLDNSRQLLSLGYLVSPDIKNTLGILPADQILFDFDMLFPIKGTFLTPFLEYDLSKILTESFATSPQKLTPGIRIQPLKPLTIDAAVDVGLSSPQDIMGHRIDMVPLWNMYLSFAFIFKPSFMKAIYRVKSVSNNLQLLIPKESLPYGHVVGTVYDAETKEILPHAVISVKGSSHCSDVLTGITTGTYKSCLLTVGPVTIEASKEGYESVERTRLILPDQEITQDFYLHRAYSFGSFIGKVVNEDDKPLLATIKFDRWDLADIVTDPSTGYFSTNLKPGEYYITITAQGYAPVISKVIITEGMKTVLEFVLKTVK